MTLAAWFGYAILTSRQKTSLSRELTFCAEDDILAIQITEVAGQWCHVMSVLRESDDGRMSRGAASCNQDLGDSAVSRKFGVRHCESVTSSPF